VIAAESHERVQRRRLAGPHSFGREGIEQARVCAAAQVEDAIADGYANARPSAAGEDAVGQVLKGKIITGLIRGFNPTDGMVVQKRKWFQVTRLAAKLPAGMQRH